MNYLYPILPDEDWKWVDELRYPDLDAALLLFKDDVFIAGVHNWFGDNVAWYNKAPFFFSSGHPGLDINTTVKRPVPFIYPENMEIIVSRVGYKLSKINGTYDNYIWGLGESGRLHQFHHLHERFSKKGEMVLRGQEGGLTGNSGESSRKHLHWSVKENGVYIDPWPLIDKSFLKPMSNVKLLQMEGGPEYGILLPIPSEEALIGYGMNFGIEIPVKVDGGIDWEALENIRDGFYKLN